MGYSIEEKLLLEHGRTSVPLTMNQFEWDLFSPKQRDEFTTPGGLKIRVLDTAYYSESNFGIVRLVKVN